MLINSLCEIIGGNFMDARTTKMANLLKQRKYIEQHLDKIADNDTGDAGYNYEGDLFPENREYFRDAHWQVIPIGRSQTGKAIHHFSCADTALTHEDLVFLGLEKPAD